MLRNISKQFELFNIMNTPEPPAKVSFSFFTTCVVAWNLKAQSVVSCLLGSLITNF